MKTLMDKEPSDTRLSLKSERERQSRVRGLDCYTRLCRSSLGIKVHDDMLFILS